MIVSNLFTDPLTTAFAQGRNSPVTEFTDNLTFLKGTHTFKTGVNVRLTTQYGYNYAGAWANINLARASGNIPPGTIGPNGSTVISSTDRTTFENPYNDLLGRNWPVWADKAFGGWDIGMLGYWQSGSVFTVTSAR